MIPLWETVFAFALVAYITKFKTYWILTVSALANVYIDQFTRPDDPYLMVTYSSIEFVTCILIIKFGDSNKLYQSIMLFLMLCLHFTMEAALVFDYGVFINSEIYVYAMSGLIVLQLIGDGRGMDKLPWTNPYRRKTHYPDSFNYQTNNFIEQGKR